MVQRKCPLCRAPQAPFLLHQAVADDNFQQFSAVIEAGADLNSFNNEDLTPLQIAIMRGNQALVRELLIRGAHPNLFNRENPESQTPLELAIRSENFIILRYLADRVDVNKAISLDWRPILHQAIASPHMTLILLQAGANPNARDANEATPLHVA